MSTKKERVMVISDLHIGSKANATGRYLPAIEEGIKQCDRLVIAGDFMEVLYAGGIFTPHDEPARLALLEKATGILLKWQKLNPNMRIQYIPGNHEITGPQLDPPMPECDAYAESLMKFVKNWLPSPVFTPNGNGPYAAGYHDAHPEYVLIGDTLIVHGHLGPRLMVESSSDLSQRIRRPVARVANVVAAGKLARDFYFKPEEWIPGIVNWVHEHPDLEDKTIKQIVFGHTHYRLNGETFEQMLPEDRKDQQYLLPDTFRDVQFYNGGAPTRFRKEGVYDSICFEYDRDSGQCSNFTTLSQKLGSRFHELVYGPRATREKNSSVIAMG